MRRALTSIRDFIGFVVAPSLFALSFVCFAGIWFCYINEDWFDRGDSALHMILVLAVNGSRIWLIGWGGASDWSKADQTLLLSGCT